MVWWIGAIRPQVIIWINVHLVVWHNIASPEANTLIWCHQIHLWCHQTLQGVSEFVWYHEGAELTDTMIGANYCYMKCAVAIYNHLWWYITFYFLCQLLYINESPTAYNPHIGCIMEPTPALWCIMGFYGASQSDAWYMQCLGIRLGDV